MQNRGDIYWVEIPHYTGSEMSKNRPALIVSHDKLNRSAPIVTVVYLTSNTLRRSEPGHVALYSSVKPSIALCEQIYTVDKSRLGSYIGTVTEGEMAEVERAISCTLDLPDYDLREVEAQIVESNRKLNDPEPMPEEVKRVSELVQELEIYKQLYENLLDRMLKSA